MIGTSTFDYCFIRTCIIGLHYLAPLCMLYCGSVIAIYGLTAWRYPVPLIVEAIAVSESLFFLLVYLPYRAYLQRDAVHPPAPSREDRKKLFDLCNSNIPDFEAYLSKWFLGSPLEDIKKDNLKEFFLWAFFNRGGPPGEDNEELEEYIKETEVLLERKFEPGRGSAKSLRLTLDKADMLHRSLTWYFCVAFVDFLTFLNLLRRGFNFHRISNSRFFTLFPLRPVAVFSANKSPAKHLTYWHRPHTSKTKLPVLFIHGIGIGLYPYVDFLAELTSDKGLESGGPDDQVGIIAIEIMSISFRITNPALSKDEFCKEVATILAHHGWDKMVLVSHSYGSVMSTHLLKSQRTADLIGPIVLIDPVSILLHLPDVAYNFTRRKPVRANEHQLHYFGSMDMGVSHTLSRHFFWSENVLWKKDIQGKNVTVSLAGKDLIVNTEAVGRYLSTGFDSDPISADSTPVLIDIEDDLSQKQTNGHVKGGSLKRFEEQHEVGKEEWKHRNWKGAGIDILWFDNLDHAQVFDKRATRRLLSAAIRAYSSTGRL